MRLPDTHRRAGLFRLPVGAPGLRQIILKGCRRLIFKMTPSPVLSARVLPLIMSFISGKQEDRMIPVAPDSEAAVPDDFMTEDEIALRTAINVLRDSIESGRMPSGQPLVPDAADLHERAARHLEALVRRLSAGPQP